MQRLRDNSLSIRRQALLGTYDPLSLNLEAKPPKLHGYGAQNVKFTKSLRELPVIQK